eukprot:TRINITY_DN27073_c0_g1_i1.p1 TRINITY_DN27073_c0_g1~~TRINITY_DN27073_c0_g1_i1.p1  ORF type:complete len:559 (+),score=120.61 TRINITY_DN27073_c0_g1_i1:57-1679(+)
MATLPDTDNSMVVSELSQIPVEEEIKEVEREESEETRHTWVTWLKNTVQMFHPHPDQSTDPQPWQDSRPLLAKWHVITFMQYFYILVFLPIRICFDVQAIMPWVFFDVIGDIIQAVDIAVKFRTAIEVKGFFITTREGIKQHYLRKVHQGFFHDVLSVLPLDYILNAVFGYDCVFRVNRLLRITYFNTYFHLFESFNPRASTNLTRLVKAACTMTFTAHLLACGFFLVLRHEGPGEEIGQTTGHPSGGRSLAWQGYYDLFELDVPRQYVRALYWAFILMTGYGNTIPVRTLETLYTILVTLVGLSVYVNVIGTVGSLVSNLDATTQAHRTKMDTLNDWMKYRRLPQTTQMKVRKYYSYMWDTRKGVDETDLLQDMPTYLRLEVSEFVNNDIIQKVPLFKDVSKAFLNAVILHLQPRVVLAGNYICKTGDVGSEMFFISSGEVNVCVEEEGKEPKIVATLTDGCFFGEVALIYHTKRTATVVAHTVCELYILKKVHFEEVLDEFSEYAKAILEKAAERFGGQATAKLRRTSKRSTPSHHSS